MTRRITLALSLVAALAATGAHAQAEPSEADVETARDLFRSGMEASQAERWNEARLAFERSYELVPRASTLLNLAAAQVEVGALVAARESYRAFLALPDEGRAGAYRDEAEAALRDAETRIARVTLTIEGLRPGDTLEVNGDARVVLEGPIPMDPGANRVVVRREGTRVGELDLTLVEGEERGVTMPLREPVSAAATTLPEATTGEEGETPLVENPWLWIGVGGGALLVAGIVFVLLVVTPAPGAYVGNVGPGTVVFE